MNYAIPYINPDKPKPFGPLPEEPLAALASMAQRFLGVDLQSRRGSQNWPDKWRARVVTSKNERAGYRLTAYGRSATEAIQALAALFRAEDAHV